MKNSKPKIKSDPKNARHHGDANKAMIRESLQEVGAFRSIALDGDNIVRAGNGVYEQAEALGYKLKIIDAKPNELIAVRRADLKGKKAIRAALYDNRTGELSDWDASILSEIAERDKELLAGLFDDEFLQNLIAQTDEVDALSSGEARQTLQEKFIVPPFSVLDARQGYWQDRKRAWIALGIQSELGRGDTPSTSARSDTPTYSPIRRRVAPIIDAMGGGKQIKMAMANDPMQRKDKYDVQATNE